MFTCAHTYITMHIAIHTIIWCTTAGMYIYTCTYIYNYVFMYIIIVTRYGKTCLVHTFDLFI